MTIRSSASCIVVAALSMGLGLPAAGEAHGDGPGGSEGGPVVETHSGLVRGSSDAAIDTFLGIPYAEPPVGELRWRPPKAKTPWRTRLDATQFGAHCWQPGTVDSQTHSSEDCLFLNVYVPKGRVWPRPVMVWIYGGANAEGESEQYDPTPLVETGGVIVVTLNYRVGPFGFLAHPALDSEGHPAVNYGILDQQLALKWVRANIAGFGGDAYDVTIFGESAGGLNATTHVVSPLSAGLFDRAIIESGAYELQTPSLASSEALGVSFATAVGCTSQTAACLRATPVATILANEGTVNTQTSAYNQATVDGQILRETQLAALTAGHINRVPVIQGSNGHEGRVFTSPTITAAEAQQTVELFAFAAGKDPNQALAIYSLSNYSTPFEVASAALGDFGFACSARTSTALLSKWVPTHEYEFNDPAAGPLGATHGAELIYLFNLSAGVTGTQAQGPTSLPAASQELATAMRIYWTHFAAFGNPNSPTVPVWLSSVLQSIQLLTPPRPTSETDAAFSAEHHCTFWD
jgi:para-nitrobenzyl esterase